jgi:hypothetical protein
MGRIVVAALAAGLAVGFLASDSPADTLGSNLIVNGDAETPPYGAGYTNVVIPGWSDTSPMTTVPYGESGGFPTVSDPGPPDRGNYFFAGGVSAFSSISQLADISAVSSLVDSGAVHFTLSGWLGGYYNHRDYSVLSASFLNGSSNGIGGSDIGPVTVSDRVGSTTELLFRSATGTVPPGARSIEIVLAATRFDGSYDDGYADNLSLVLTPVPEPSALAALLSMALMGAVLAYRRVRGVEEPTPLP